MSAPSETKPAARGAGLVALWDLCRILRGPGGCPWDREQTPASLTPYLVEETYEILESVSHDDWKATSEELGDSLFLLMFLAEMAEERGAPGLDALAWDADRKLRRRHPHLFESPEEISSSDQQRRWQHLKQAEKGSASVLGQFPAGAPSLTAAYRTQEKASSVGFDWPSVEGVIDKIEEELVEVREAMKDPHGRREEDLRHELGDLLFAVTNLARYLKIDPERELRATVGRFRRRFLHIEERLAAEGRTPSESTLEEMDALWNEAKMREREEKP